MPENVEETAPDRVPPRDIPATGDQDVDAMLGVLAGLADEPVSGHAALYASLHENLLGALNTEPAAPVVPRPGQMNPKAVD